MGAHSNTTESPRCRTHTKGRELAHCLLSGPSARSRRCSTCVMMALGWGRGSQPVATRSEVGVGTRSPGRGLGGASIWCGQEVTGDSLLGNGRGREVMSGGGGIVMRSVAVKGCKSQAQAGSRMEQRSGAPASGILPQVFLFFASSCASGDGAPLAHSPGFWAGCPHLELHLHLRVGAHLQSFSSALGPRTRSQRLLELRRTAGLARVARLLSPGNPVRPGSLRYQQSERA